jgi:hypothetical protein
MSLAPLIQLSLALTAPPAGAVNVRVGKAVEGPGGRWLPCATAIADGLYVASIYEVGPGRRQVCAAEYRTNCVDDALSNASALAATAAA